MKLWCIYHSADTEPFIKINLFNLRWALRLWRRTEIVLQLGDRKATLKRVKGKPHE